MILIHYSNNLNYICTMNYRTIVTPKDYDFKISHQSNLFLIGSCFSQTIGNKLISNKLNTMVNPFGILFNPISIVNTLNDIIEEKEFTVKDLHFDNGLYHSFAHHGSFSGPNSEEVLIRINQSRKVATSFLKKTDVIIITLGSSWAYKYNDTHEFVANCHKVPNKEFTKELLEVGFVVENLQGVIDKLQAINSTLKVIFTLSPVRHWKDGVEENTLSKSILNVAIHQLAGNKAIYYFPAYEMVIDDLRDYRFYKEDMLHPNDVAVEYVWNGFENSFFSKKTVELNKEIGKVAAATNHTPIHIQSIEHQEFLKNQLSKINHLISLYPTLNFENEIEQFTNQTV
jgi:hypothetical protein